MFLSLVSNISFRGFQKYYIVNIRTSCSYFINAFNLVWLLNSHRPPTLVSK
jgi:hypothetical protein